MEKAAFETAAPIVAAALLFACPSDPLSGAEKLESSGKLEAAAQAYVRIAKADPANLAAWDRAVDIQCRRRIDVGACMGILDLELDLLGTLKRHHDVLSRVLERRARARLTQGLAEAALEDLARAEKAAPERASVQVAKAKALATLGRADEAHQTLLKARSLDPTNEEASALFAELPKPTEELFGGGAKRAPGPSHGPGIDQLAGKKSP